MTFITFGILYIHHRAFTSALAVLICSSFFNLYLKSIWQIPLHPSLGKEGWAFPSGHTQFNTVLWVMLAHHIRKPWVYTCGILINIGCYFGMRHFDYHTWYDIFGGVVAAAFVYLCFLVWEKYDHNINHLTVGSLLLAFLFYSLMPQKCRNESWLFGYIGSGIGLLIHLLCVDKKILLPHPRFKVTLRCLEVVVIILSIYAYAYCIPVKDSPSGALIKSFVFSVVTLTFTRAMIQKIQNIYYN